MSIGKEVILCKARLSEKSRRLKEMRMRADDLIILIRESIDPYAEDFTTLDMNKAVLQVNDLAELQRQANELKAEIAKLEKDLNG